MSAKNESNAVFIIQPYRVGKVWCFDEPALGVFKEPFVGTINDMIDDMLERAGLPQGEQFTALFSADKLPSADMQLVLDQSEGKNGAWYKDVTKGGKTEDAGWLCPCLFKFFPSAPENIYVRVAQ